MRFNGLSYPTLLCSVDLYKRRGFGTGEVFKPTLRGQGVLLIVIRLNAMDGSCKGILTFDGITKI